MFRQILFFASFGLLVACNPTVLPPEETPPRSSRQTPVALPTPKQAAQNFAEVVERVEPVAERMCRQERPQINCDFQIVVDRNPKAPPNAYQTVDRNGRPIIGFTIALIADARNKDELAFILGHEAAHHIAGHLPRQQESALRGAVLAGVLASLGGIDASGVEAAVDIGAHVGARSYSKEFELEADAKGTVIAYRAGFDPALGAAFFNRIPDPGNRFLGTHPPNAQRIQTVQRTLRTIR